MVAELSLRRTRASWTAAGAKSCEERPWPDALVFEALRCYGLWSRAFAGREDSFAGRGPRSPLPPIRRQKIVAALALSGAAAYVAPVAPKATTALNSKAELEALAMSNTDALGQSMGFWDPLGLADGDFWGLGNEGTIGYLRHAEIKHGRVAMAGFLGFIAQCTPLVSGEHAAAPYRGYVAGVTPQEQWDNIPQAGKLQIIAFVGMLESYGEGAGNPDGYTHYTKGGLPGFYPSIKGKGGGQITFDLYKPFPIFPEQSEAQKERGRRVEVNNGRAAMLGLMSLLSASAVPGSVPALSGIEGFPQYSGNVMIPFEGDFTLF